MAEEVIYTRMYSGQEGWWNSNIIPRTSCTFNGSAAMPASISCSTEFTDMGGGFNWAAPVAADASQSQSQLQSQSSSSSSDESAGSVVSNNSLSFRGTRHAAAAPMTDLHAVSSSPAVDWNQKPPWYWSSAAREESGGYHDALFQLEGDELSTSLRGDDLQLLNSDQKNDMCDENTTISSVLVQHNINQGLPQYQQHYESLLRSLLELPEISEPCYTQPLPDPSPPKHQPLQFSTNTNNTSSANRSSTSPINKDLLRLPSPGKNVASLALKENSNRSNRAAKSASEGVAGGLSANVAAQQPALKKPRIETPSPLPTFKVRKEKMGDRITALQQLVSPFGKTDTASVLTEAIEYIKFLHDQVGVLSAPYLNNGNQMLHLKSLEKLNGAEGPKRDLGSRGLCLMPVSSTYAVASEIPFDFWAPTFGGSFN